jgi:hypothetical protein
MLIETLSVREAREQSPSVLERFRGGGRTPVGVGSRRQTEAVDVDIDVTGRDFDIVVTVHDGHIEVSG